MNIGPLDQRIRFERKFIEQDETYGTETVTWVEHLTLWANVQEVLPSRAETQAQGIRIENRPARIRVRYEPSIASDMRVVLLERGGRLLKIISGPAELGRREGLELMAEEFSTQGDGP